MDIKKQRAAFEKAMNDARFFPRELDFTLTKSPSGRDEYANSHLQSNWSGWLARGADDQLKQATEALRPFADVGGWLFARNLPDDTPVVEIKGINGSGWVLTRGEFKAAFSALRAIEHVIADDSILDSESVQTDAPKS